MLLNGFWISHPFPSGWIPSKCRTVGQRLGGHCSGELWEIYSSFWKTWRIRVGEMKQHRDDPQEWVWCNFLGTRTLPKGKEQVFVIINTGGSRTISTFDGVYSSIGLWPWGSCVVAIVIRADVPYDALSNLRMQSIKSGWTKRIKELCTQWNIRDCGVGGMDEANEWSNSAFGFHGSLDYKRTYGNIDN